MRKSWLLCVLLGTLAWGQAAPGTPPPPAAAPGNAQAPVPMARPQGPPGAQQAPMAPPDTSASVPATAAVITIVGVCPAQPKTAAAKGTTAKPATAGKTPAAKTPAADCKTIITKAEFEKLANALAPNLTPQLRKQLGSILPQLIAMTNAAEKQNLDKTPEFKQKLKFARMQLLSREVTQNIQKEAAKVPEEQIASYYKEHPDSFELFNLDRMFVPRTKQPEAEGKEDKDDDKDAKLTEEQQKAKQAEEKAKADAAEQAMTQLAESLRARAAAGEDFAKLQKEAFDAAGMKIESPTVTMPKVRRSALPPAHVSVLELKVGEVSQVISDNGGHYIYKVNSKDLLTLDQARDEIHSTLTNQRSREMTEKMNSSFHAEPNEAYFGPGGPAMPPRIQNRMNAPSSMAPRQQTPPAAQAPAPQPPAAKPN
jgi:hypothetical protein